MSFSQNLENFDFQKKSKCGGVFFYNKENIQTVWGNAIRFIDIKNDEKIADIGSRSMTFVAALGAFANNANFYCEDIDSVCMNDAQLDIIKAYCEKIQPNYSSKINYILGTFSSTKLPLNFFDKVILNNSLHEFDSKDEMMQQINIILKKNGKLFVNEGISNVKGEKHPGCNAVMFEEDSLILLVTSHGFSYVKAIESPVATGCQNSKFYLFEKL